MVQCRGANGSDITRQNSDSDMRMRIVADSDIFHADSDTDTV